MTPFEAVFGRAPLSLIDCLGDYVMVDVVDNLLKDRTLILETLKANLWKAQTRMCNKANAHRTDVSFQMDDWVFLKLQPHRQSTIAHQ